MAEVYTQALLRDTHVSHLRDPIGGHNAVDVPAVTTPGPCKPRELIGFSVQNALDLLAIQSEWFGLADNPQSAQPRLARRLGNVGDTEVRAARPLTDAERMRLRPTPLRQTIFRGIGPGAQVGPYLSQFLLIGNSGINSRDMKRAIGDGMISYGSLHVDQHVRLVCPTSDDMTTFK